ncbi:hypothetical protein PENSPDRAFT_75046 [Peniophora sp. CONT]|nr:hypothetical protein PENSPDRAFT_75046 [Peniophora sp. CONT]
MRTRHCSVAPRNAIGLIGPPIHCGVEPHALGFCWTPKRTHRVPVSLGGCAALMFSGKVLLLIASSATDSVTRIVRRRCRVCLSVGTNVHLLSGGIGSDSHGLCRGQVKGPIVRALDALERRFTCSLRRLRGILMKSRKHSMYSCREGTAGHRELLLKDVQGARLQRVTVLSVPGHRVVGLIYHLCR